MKKQFFARLILGMFVAPCISFAIALGISIGIGDGTFYPVASEATEFFGSELAATAFLFFSTLGYGACWGAASMMWDLPKWSLLRKTVTHFLLLSTVTFPVLWFNFWVDHTVWSVLGFYLLFILIYVSIWLGTYFGMRRSVTEINEKLRQDSRTR